MKRLSTWFVTIVKYLIGISVGIGVCVFIFAIYCFLVTHVTPWVYEHHGMQRVEQQIATDSVQTLGTVHNSIYGDEYTNSRIGVLGTFGDSSGFMNAFFAFLAFAVVGSTFIYQTRKDTKDKRLAKKSEFESVFFNMTSTLEDIVTHLEYRDRVTQSNLFSGNAAQGTYWEGNEPNELTEAGQNTLDDRVCKGREIFQYLYCEKLFTLDTGQQVAGIKEFINGNERMTGAELQEKVFDGSLDHYFRYAYRILKYIDKSDLINNQEKKEFAAILRAQISCYELLTLFINCIEMDNNKFKHLIEKYCMFNNIRIDLLPQIFQDVYLDKINKRKERKGYEKKADSEYSITAFCKEAESVRVTRFEVFHKIWELRFSRRVEQEHEA